MSRQRKLVSVFLLLSTCSAAQEKPIQVKLTIKYNGKATPNPDHITLSSGSHIETVAVRDGRFDVPAEISHAKTWSLAAVIKGDQIEVSLSQRNLAYEDWTLHLADHHYNQDYNYAVTKGADVRSSCILVLDSEHIDPGLVIFQTNCRRKR